MAILRPTPILVAVSMRVSAACDPGRSYGRAETRAVKTDGPRVLGADAVRCRSRPCAC